MRIHIAKIILLILYSLNCSGEAEFKKMKKMFYPMSEKKLEFIFVRKVNQEKDGMTNLHSFLNCLTK